MHGQLYYISMLLDFNAIRFQCYYIEPQMESEAETWIHAKMNEWNKQQGADTSIHLIQRPLT